MTDAERAWAWLRALAIERSTTVVPAPGGAALLHADLPAAHDHNLLLVWAETDADAVADAAETILGGAGIEHQAVQVHGDALASALSPGLITDGFERTDTLLMRPAGAAPAGAGGASAVGTATDDPDEDVNVETLTLDERVVMGSASWLDDAPEMPAEEVRQLGERIRGTAALVDATFLVVRDADGNPVAYGDVYARDGVVQLEELYALKRVRNGGIGAALVREAARRAAATRPDLTFLCVNADGPIRLYERLGFETFARTTTFARSAASTSGTG
jgi:ribosomal protein S18 acetylase RimI-like enzyme